MCQNVKATIWTALIIVVASYAAPASASAPSECKVQRVLERVRYAPSTLLDLKLELFEAPSELLVLMIHGGGWDKGDRDAFWAEQFYFGCRGWANAALNYRLSDQAIFPAPWEDVWSAIRFLGREHKHIVLMGHSAGGHLAALAGLWPPKDLSPQEKDLVVGVIGISGVYDLTYDMQRKLNWPFRIPLERMLGGSYDTAEIQQRAVQASPVAHLQAATALPQTPRFLLIHGKQDDGVPLPQTIEFDAALKAAKLPVETHIIPNAGHYVLNDQRDKTLAVIEDFLREIESGLSGAAKARPDAAR